MKHISIGSPSPSILSPALQQELSDANDVLDFANFASFPAAGDEGRLYKDLEKLAVYSWNAASGVYEELAKKPQSTDELEEGDINLYFTAARAGAALSSELAGKLNKSGGELTGALVLSGNAEADLEPVTLLQMNAALDGKQDSSEKGEAGGYAPLNVGGVVPNVHIPTLAKTTVIVTASSNYTAPANAKRLRVICLGGGGGGGSGRKGASGSTRGGGGGGGAGGYSEYSFEVGELVFPIAITIPSGGIGGASVVAASTNGSAGSPGGVTKFGDYLQAFGGLGGPGGSAGAASGGVGGVGAVGVSNNGAASSLSAGAVAIVNAGNACGAGGSGGALTSANVANSGGAGSPGARTLPQFLTLGGAGGAVALAGQNGATSSRYGGGGGGGGSGSAAAGIGAAGGNGGRGAGGGGGGGGGVDVLLAPQGGNSGAGGDGGAGVVIIECYS
jgi:hypothetical protein